MWLLSVKPSTVKDKRYTAVFCKCKVKNECKGTFQKTVHFGQDTATTYVDGAPESKKSSYLARHGAPKAGQDWSKPDTAGSLAKHLLWGASRSLRQNIKSFKNKFKL